MSLEAGDDDRGGHFYGGGWLAWDWLLVGGDMGGDVGGDFAGDCLLVAGDLFEDWRGEGVSQHIVDFLVR